MKIQFIVERKINKNNKEYSVLYMVANGVKQFVCIRDKYNSNAFNLIEIMQKDEDK